MKALLLKPIRAILILTAMIAALCVLFALSFFAWTKHLMLQESLVKNDVMLTEQEPFPVSVQTVERKIVENPTVDWYVKTHLSFNGDNSRQSQFLDKILAQVAKWDWYQQLASSVSRILVIYSGERAEQVVANFGDILKWSEEERALFVDYISQTEPYLIDGTFYPGRYVVPSDASPELVADLLHERFSKEVLARYTPEVEVQVPLKDALIIASLLEREAYDFTDMRYIAGIIWNRLFINMPLQLDATLQYARGGVASAWWPRVVPDDKFIESPFNTYKNTGLPPSPISNPSVESIMAALNPRVTPCMFYFHDSNGRFYCTETYEEHVAKLREIYGQGR
jgi:cell division protein YceG involved in septum cleavage